MTITKANLLRAAAVLRELSIPGNGFTVKGQEEATSMAATLETLAKVTQ